MQHIAGRLAVGILSALLLIGCGNSEPAGTPEGNDAAAQALASVRLQEDPLRICMGEAPCFAPLREHALPQPYVYAEATRPAPNPLTTFAFPAFGWVVGRSKNALIPDFIWQGNRLAGVDSGMLYEATGVRDIQRATTQMTLTLETNYDDAPAQLVLRGTDEGALSLELLPPETMREAGIAVTLVTLDSPDGEGLFGMGGRKDYFNQRGLRRNVWTEQQYTGIGRIEDLDLGGATGIPLRLPTRDQLAALGLNLDVDDPLLLEERTSFPNGAQSTHWPEAFVVGARGWGVWSPQTHFQRLDLAATHAERIRWQIVEADRFELVLANGGIEAVTRTYTDYWGRAPAPPRAMYAPWIDTLNQGEGEAAPNGQGFWGGQRARCEIEDFIAKAQPDAYDIPFGVIGVEGWQTLPTTHPECLTMTTEAICAHPSGFPQSESEWRAEVDTGHSFFNSVANCPRNDDNFLDYLRERGFNVAGYWNFFHTDPECDGDDAAGCRDDRLSFPLASQEAFYAARDAGLYVKAAGSNENAEVTTNRGGVSHILDFSTDAATDYWQGQLTRMLDQGIGLFMNDFGELTTGDMRFASEQPINEAHNAYAFNLQRTTRNALDRYRAGDGDTPAYFYARAGTTGACSFTPSVFPGDETTTFDPGHGLPSVIPAMLNLALSGCYVFTTDIGGYFDFLTRRTNEELFIRWSQLAALTPVMRIHSSTFNGSVFPWTWAEGNGPDAQQFDSPGIFRRYAHLKQRLIPLVDRWAQRAAKQGVIGPVRPLVLEDRTPAAMAVDYQWLLGEDLLVAPVTSAGAQAQSVYFPRGSRWQQLRVSDEGRLQPTGAIFDGGNAQDIPVDPDTLQDIPLFVRCGSTAPDLPLAGTAC